MRITATTNAVGLVVFALPGTPTGRAKLLL